jgi:putative phosphotransacetylase
MKIKIEVSARHIHLSKKDLDILFGEGYELKPMRKLSQEGTFAAEEKIDLKFEDRVIKGVRVLGPIREETQVELSRTECFFLKLNAPLRSSGDLEGSVGITLIGPKGQVELSKGVIVAKRHIHCNKKESNEIGAKEGEMVSVKVEGERSLIFNNVEVRIKDNFNLTMNIDTDEGNTSGVFNIGEGEVLK